MTLANAQKSLARMPVSRTRRTWTAPITVHVTAEQEQYVLEIASDLNTTLSQVIRGLIDGAILDAQKGDAQ